MYTCILGTFRYLRYYFALLWIVVGSTCCWSLISVCLLCILFGVVFRLLYAFVSVFPFVGRMVLGCLVCLVNVVWALLCCCFDELAILLSVASLVWFAFAVLYFELLL